MGLSVVCLTAFLTFLVLGYNVGDGWKIERSGLLQINSNPTGATVRIDGEEGLLARTNLSRAYSSGTHLVTLVKSGYGQWEKKITITEGFYYRLSYPRLFLDKIEKKTISEALEFDVLDKSPSGNEILGINIEKMSFQLLKLDGDKMTAKELAFDQVRNEALVSAEIVEWSKSGDEVLLRLNYGGGADWVLLDLDDGADSVNLTATFGLDFEQIKMENSSAEKILVLSEGDLREINTKDKDISRVLLSGVERFDSMENVVAYVTVPDESGKVTVGVYTEGEKAGVKIRTIENPTDEVFVVIDEYFEDDFLAIGTGNSLMIYQGKIPSYGQKVSSMSLIMNKELSFKIEEVETKGAGELIIAKNANMVAIMDAEAFAIEEYEMKDVDGKWLDEFMLYGTKDGKLTVWDFDNLNEKTLIGKGVKAGSLVTISSSGRWIYYFNEENKLVVAKVS